MALRGEHLLILTLCLLLATTVAPARVYPYEANEIKVEADGQRSFCNAPGRRSAKCYCDLTTRRYVCS